MKVDSNEHDALASAASTLSNACHTAAIEASDEENLRYEIEKAIEQACGSLSISVQQYRFEIQLKTELNITNYADSMHGALIIEYEFPRSFSKGSAPAKISHAKDQAENYAKLMTKKEGRKITNYYLIVFDGETISFGRFQNCTLCIWEPCQDFTLEAAKRFLVLLRDQGTPLVSPRLLRIEFGIASQVGKLLLPALFNALISAINEQDSDKSKTYLLFTEWSRLFGQAVGVSSERLSSLLHDTSTLHGISYRNNIPAYLFSLHTYLALIAKLVAAMALPNASFQISDPNVPIKKRLQLLESGELYANYNIINMLSGDFFSWYIDDKNWNLFEDKLNEITNLMNGISFDIAKMTAESVRDLFKGLYQEIIPKDLRHSLGEIYTPDWLAAFAFNKIGWKHHESMLDPACGTGTFLIEAIKKRLSEKETYLTANQLLNGIYGIDLNPLAVLASKASLVLLISKFLPGDQKVYLPIFLADSINQVEEKNSFYEHTMQTEIKDIIFRIPKNIGQSEFLFEIFEKLRLYIDEGFNCFKIYASLQDEFGTDLFPQSGTSEECLVDTIESLLYLHEKKWNSIWCSILADRFSVCSIKNVSHILGNPPWVKWSNLPAEYANFIKPICKSLNVFGDSKYVGGIESDISIVFTYKAMQAWLKENGKLAFFITGTIFSDQSSQGFRRFCDSDGQTLCGVLSVDDFQAIKPFEGVSNHPTLLILHKGIKSNYPIPYVKWEKMEGTGTDASEATDPCISQFKEICLSATPIPGKIDSPWLKGHHDDLLDWSQFFDASQEEASYVARKGITTDLNGVYFINVLQIDKSNVTIENNPDLGKGINRKIPKVKRIIEPDHIFPLLRGRHVHPYFASIDPTSFVLLPQRGMYGEPDLPRTHSKTLSYLKIFKDRLELRGSYRRFQKGYPYWSVWSTGTYTFSKYKVVWREMLSGMFAAACITPLMHKDFGEKIVIPDHKIYFIATDDLEEAYFLTGILNSPTLSRAITSYAAQLSFGTSLCKYIKFPVYNSKNKDHDSIVGIVSDIYKHKKIPSSSIQSDLDTCVKNLF